MRVLTRSHVSPYKGLSAYGPDDVELFAARDSDVNRIAYRLGDPDIGILILHGRTGCGKSSFLRAGLIPHLERPEHGFGFLQEKSEGAANKRVLFVRCTEDPLSQIGEEIWSLCAKPFSIDTPTGPRQLDLPALLAEYRDSRERFVTAVNSDGRILVEVLSKLADALPETLVIIVDQAEEVLTLGGGSDKLERHATGNKSKDEFFSFLSKFSVATLDLKLLLVIRTEFFGEFSNEIQRRQWRRSGVLGEVLGELNTEQIISAIERPTETAQYNLREVYRFRVRGWRSEGHCRRPKDQPLQGRAIANNANCLRKAVCHGKGEGRRRRGSTNYVG